MDQLKFGVLLSGIAGLVGCFLPIVSGGPSLWDVHTVDMAQVLMVLVPLALASLLGVVAVARPPMLRWQGLVAATCFGFVLFKMRDGLMETIKHGGLGGRLLTIAPIAGLVFSILSLAIAAPAVRR